LIKPWKNFQGFIISAIIYIEPISMKMEAEKMRNKKQRHNILSPTSFFLGTPFLFYSSFLIGFFIILLGIGLGEKPYASEIYTSTVLLLGIPWILFSCIVVIIRKEVPRLGLDSIRGGWAVFQGILGLIVYGGTWIFLLYVLIRETISK